MKRLSRSYIETIANNILAEYMKLPELTGIRIYRIEPEILLTKVLGLNIENAHLSMDGSILGLTSFSDVEVEIYDETDMETFLFLDGKTIVIEKELATDVSKRGRYNFTAMHEGSHQIFKRLFPNDYGASQSTEELHFHTYNSEKNKPIMDWEEWQANALASSLLLPETLIKQGMFIVGLGDKVYSIHKYNREVYERFCNLADFLGSSKQALAIRMKQLGLLEKEYIHSPNSIFDIYREV